jgi:recombination protein RecT
MSAPTTAAARLRDAANAPAEASSGPSPVVKLQSMLEKYKSQMALALPKHLTPDRMCRLALSEFSKSEKLQQCDSKSIIASVMTATQIGLEIGVLGQGFLVPYYDNKARCMRAQFIPGWQGMVDLVSRAGRANVWTGAVFEGDDFDYALGDSPFVRHRPGEENDPAKLTHVYAIGRVNGSNWPVIEVWPIAKVLKHRDKFNKVGDSHYSFKNWEMYARKIPLLQVLKYIPKSIELSNALEIDNAVESGRGATLDGSFISLGNDMSEGPALTDDRASQAEAAIPQTVAQPEKVEVSRRTPDDGGGMQVD